MTIEKKLFPLCIVDIFINKLREICIITNVNNLHSLVIAFSDLFLLLDLGELVCI